MSAAGLNRGEAILADAVESLGEKDAPDKSAAFRCARLLNAAPWLGWTTGGQRAGTDDREPDGDEGDTSGDGGTSTRNHN